MAFLGRIGKFELAGIALGVWISFPAIFSLAYGLAGMKGHSLLTGMALAACLLAISLLLFRRVVPVAADGCFVLLVAAMAITYSLNAGSVSSAETALLLLTLASYVACRLASDEMLARAGIAFMAVCLIVVGFGTAATAVALVENWGGRPKPTVLGLDATPTQLVQILAILVLAGLTLVTLTMKRALAIAAIAAIPVAIFSAAQVRFALAALVGSVVLVTLLCKGRQRKLVLLVGLVIVLAVIAGAAARYAKTQILANYALEGNRGVITWQRPPSCDLTVNPKNSIAIRKALALDGLYLVPRAGFFGTGLDSFMRFSCVKLTQIHNAILQTFVEFGWIGGVFFLALLGVSLQSIARLSQTGSIPLFLLSGLAYLIMISMAHGRLSNEMSLFAVLGVIAGYAETSVRRQSFDERNS